MKRFLEKFEKNKEYSVYVDYYIAILLGVATVLTAIAAYQGSLWSGNSLSNYNKSVSTLSDANGLYLEYLNDYTHTELLDLKDDLLYTQWKQTPASDPDKEYLFSRLSEGLQKDLEKKDTDAKNETSEKEARDTEIDAKYTDSQALFDQSSALMGKAEKANENGDKFTFATVLFAIVLFFGGLSTTTAHTKLKLGYIVLSSILFLYSLLYVCTLPFP